MAFLAPIAVPLAIAGTVLQAVGSITSGIAAGRAGKAQQKAANQAASVRRQQGNINYRQSLLEGRRFAGEQLAAIAGSGVDVGLGSPLELAADTAREVEWRANLSRWEAESDAVALENRGRLAKWEGNVRKTQAFARAAGQLFSAGAMAGREYGGGGDDPLATYGTTGRGELTMGSHGRLVGGT